MSVNTDFAVGIAQIIDAASLGVWDPARDWTAADTQTAIMLRSVPEDPSKLISLSVYSVDDDPKMTDSTRALQIRLRGDENPGTTTDLDEALFDLLQGRHDTAVNGVPVVLMWRQSSLPGPQDANGRYQHSSNWYWRTAIPTQFRED